MRTEKKIILAIAVISIVLLVAGNLRADWILEDGHKMHYPQLPDPDGWDVNICVDNIWDDWRLRWI